MDKQGTALIIIFHGHSQIMQRITDPRKLNLEKAWKNISEQQAPNKKVLSVRLVNWKEVKKLYPIKRRINRVMSKTEV